MLASQHRFHGHNSLRFVYSRGQTARGQLMSMKYAVNARRREWRAAVVVSRKVSKSAVVRNRIRRRTYAILRDESSRIKEPYDIVITVFSEEVANIDNDKLRELLLAQLNRAGITTS